MKKLTPIDQRKKWLSSLQAMIKTSAPLPIIEWCETHVDYSLDSTNAWKGTMKVRAYQREILEASKDPNVREIDMLGSPRIGKSMIWKVIVLNGTWEGAESAIIVYQNEEEGLKSNRDTLEPLMKCNKRLAAWLAEPRSRTIDSYHLGQSIIYFQGAGAQILNKSARLCIGDEVDYWLLPGVGQGNQAETRNIDNVSALKMRGQTFSNRLLYLSSTPTTPDGPIWKRFQKSSGGVYHLRCLNCGHLIPCGQLAFPVEGKGYAGLQWLKDEKKMLIPDSIRYICPRCWHEHHFSDAGEMVQLGQYVHERPDCTWHRGFRASALCCPDVFSWQDIADAQENAIDLQSKRLFANYYLARPFVPSQERDKKDAPDIIKGHFGVAQDGEITSVFMAVDVQGYGDGSGLFYVYVVRGFSETGDSWLLKYGKAQNLAELSAVADGIYASCKIVMGVLDQGGFSHERTGCNDWIHSRQNWYWYKGDTQTKETAINHWGESQNVSKLILAHPGHYQTIVLDAIYGGDGGARWHIPESVDEEYIRHIMAMKPSQRRFDGEQYDRWSANSERHDFFDAEKMIYVAVDISKKKTLTKGWPRGNMPLFMRRQILAALKNAQLLGRT